MRLGGLHWGFLLVLLLSGATKASLEDEGDVDFEDEEATVDTVRELKLYDLHLQSICRRKSIRIVSFIQWHCKTFLIL